MLYETTSRPTGCAIANETLQSVNHIKGIHDNGPPDHGLKRLKFNSVLFPLWKDNYY